MTCLARLCLTFGLLAVGPVQAADLISASAATGCGSLRGQR